MATVSDACATLAAQINTILAPYQPNISGYPNLAATAGTIAATLVAQGQAIQVKVLTRLENHMAQVDVYEGKVTKSMPFERQNYIPSMANLTSLGGGQYSYNRESARELKEVIVRVWAETHPAREAIAGLIRSGLGDAFRQTETDSTTTVVRFFTQADFDQEQKDSIYVKQLHYMADVTAVEQVVLTLVTETELTTTITAGGQSLTPETQDYP